MALAALLDQGMSLLPVLQQVTSDTLEAAKPADSMSVIDRVMDADPVVQAVMAVLVIASIWSWAVAIDKWFAVSAANGRARRFENAFWSGQPVEDMNERVSDKPADAMARVFAAGAREWREARRTQPTDVQAEAMLDRARAQMSVAVARESSRMEGGLRTLAIIASAAPFIGLFGTVIGIMNAFNSIDPTQQINLGIVGPGIAEALLATAIGLGAAVPALIFYNKFSGDIAKFTDRLELFAEEFSVRLSRRVAGGRED